MTIDPLDAVLNAAAPAQRRVEPSDTHAMIVAARGEARSPRRSRRNALLSGALALVLVGGAGIATASGDWLWGPGLENPDRVYTYTSPSWGECELRFSALDTHDPILNAQVNRVVDDWFASTNVEAAAAPLVPGYLATIEASAADDPAAQQDPRSADLAAWTAHEQAVGQLVHEELAAHGFTSEVLAGTDSHGQVHCDAEDWGAE
jgi:hypothetical protein